MTFDSATPSQGTLLRVERHRHLRARHDRRRRPTRPSRSRSRPSGPGHDHEPGDASRPTSPTPTRPTTTASAETTVDPVADLSLTKSDSPDPVLAGELLTYTLRRRATPGPRDATGVDAHRHAAGRRDLRLGHALAGQLLRGERHGHLRARHDRRTARARASRSRSRPQDGGHDHQPGNGVASDEGDSDTCRTTPRAPRRPSTRPPTCR